jgi:cobalt-zinc-cadmium efflux system outer membrane protein
MCLRQHRTCIIVFAVLASALLVSPASAQKRALGADDVGPLTRDRVIELAKSQAPPVRIAETQVEESRGQLVGAQIFARENPVLEGLVGPRWATDRTTDVEATLALPIELGARRPRRIAVAKAAIERNQHLVADAQRVTVGAALAGYYRVLHAEARLALARERKALADELLQTAVARQRAGDVATFEVNLAEGEQSRAESEIESEAANVARERAVLAALLGLSSGGSLAIEGDLKDRSLFERIPDDATAAERPDVKAGKAQMAESNAEISLADTARLPDISFRVTYAHEEDADIVLGGVAISLPLFERGQGDRLAARARRNRAVIELQARENAASAELEGARAAFQASVLAVRRLEEKGLPRAIENEAMARESHRTGKIDLSAFLLIRRDALETRREHVDRLLEAALAGVDLFVATGANP